VCICVCVGERKDEDERPKTSVNKGQGWLGSIQSTTPLTVFALLDVVGHSWLDNVRQGWQGPSHWSTSSIKLTKRLSSQTSSSPI
jgi:hypothetical protein